MKKARAALITCIDFFIDFSFKIDGNPSPKVAKTIFVRKNNEKSLPGALFWAKDRFLIDLEVPEGTSKPPKSYGSAVGMGVEARLFIRIH